MKAKKPFIVVKDDYGTMGIMSREKDIISATKEIEYYLDSECIKNLEESEENIDNFLLFKVSSPAKTLVKSRKKNRYLVFHNDEMVINDANYVDALEEIKKVCEYEYDSAMIQWDKFEIYVNPKVFTLDCDASLQFDVSAY